VNGLLSSEQNTDEVDLSEQQRYERIKLFFLSLAFIFLIGGHTLIKELKDSLFVAIVGKDYIPIAKQLTFLIMVPLVFIYAKLVDRLRRYQLIYVCTTFFGILGIIFAYLLGHPEIGIENTDQSPYRIFGWFLYFAFEANSPFIVSVFWAFANSITSPEGAKRDYALMISGSKIAGASVALGAWALLRWRDSFGNHVFSNVVMHQFLLVGASLLLLCVPLIISLLIRMVPGRFLHGYEAVYQVEKDKAKAETALKVAVSLLDKLAGKRVIHPNKAANQKSKLTKLVNKLS